MSSRATASIRRCSAGSCFARSATVPSRTCIVENSTRSKHNSQEVSTKQAKDAWRVPLIMGCITDQTKAGCHMIFLQRCLWVCLLRATGSICPSVLLAVSMLQKGRQQLAVRSVPCNSTDGQIPQSNRPACLLCEDEAVTGGVLEPCIERIQGRGRARDRGAAAPGLDLDEARWQLPGSFPTIPLLCARLWHHQVEAPFGSVQQLCQQHTKAR